VPLGTARPLTSSGVCAERGGGIRAGALSHFSWFGCALHLPVGRRG